MIYKTFEEFAFAQDYMPLDYALTSGPFHLIHRGHIQLLTDAARVLANKRFCGRLAVAVNGDGFLMRKHGYVGVPLEDRLAIVDAIKGVSAVFPYDDGTQSVAGCILRIQPCYFLKGGDRSCPENICPEELLACRKVGCEILYGVGGSDKPNSSSLIAARVAAGYRSQNS